jgi:hypothetical protein
MYQSIDQEGDKRSTYTYYINAETKHPVHYEMFGYDTLIGSHFDKYTIDYYNYDEKSIDSTLFHITDGNLFFFILLLFLIIISNLFNRNEMYRLS